ncbi:MAG: nucleolar RNA-binding Nop10p family protein, partial [Thermosphaera sp.]
MNWLMRKCPKCGIYTLSIDKCPACNSELIV